MKFIQVFTDQGGRWHVAGCRELKKPGNMDHGNPSEFGSYEDFIKKYCSHLIDPNESGMTLADAIKEVKNDFCACARKLLN